MNPMITSDLDMPGLEPEPEMDEKQDVATITTDEVQPMEEDKPSADDQEAIKKRFLPPDPDLEIIDETVYVFQIKNWQELEDKVHSPSFECGGVPWRLLMFPFGNNANRDCCSFYLEHNFEEKPPETWYACVQFLFVLSNPNDPSIYHTSSAHHRFNSDATDWGFTRFTELRKMLSGWHDPGGRPLLENNAAKMTIFVRVVRDPTGVLWHNFENYDSKKETGMVGLKNQGATCYLNSLLQSLYLTNAFRKAIYQIPTEDETNPRGNSAYALQRLFYLLQHMDQAVSTSELTASFGWDSRQIFEQQDVQELSRILMDRMEARMKGTEAEKALPNLFVGSTKTFLECINVDYESSSSQVFWDVQLNVRGKENLDESFKDCLQVETMDGDNKYFAEGFGLQDARKGDIFEKFPPVLHLQLKRFEYNWQYDTTTKINDRFEFPEQFDASPYLSKDADRTESLIYNLHGVLVHSGDLNAGHYYAFLKPNKEGDFYKFDDDRVTRATKKEAIDENFGGEFANPTNGVNGMQRNPFTFKYSKHRFMSAYMLVYIRQSRLDDALHPIGDADVPAHLDKKITEEQADIERRRKEREEAHLYMQCIVGTIDNFNAFQGFDIFASPHSTDCDPAAPPKLRRLLRTTKIAEFNKMMAAELGTEEDLIRTWVCIGRQNHTVRPDTPLTALNYTLEEANHKMTHKLPFKLWVEKVARNANGEPDWADAEAVTNLKNPTQPILLFLKHFNVTKQTLLGVGYVYIDKSKKVTDLGLVILERMGWHEGTQIRLYEEIKADMIEPLKTANTFASSELQNGDIICFQKHLPEADANELVQEGKLAEAPRFYEYLANRVSIMFYDKTDLDNESKAFELELSKKMPYDRVAAKVAEHLKVDPTHIRFSTVVQSSNRPKVPMQRKPNMTLQSMLSSQTGIYGTAAAAVRSDLLVYEVLEISLSELETKKNIKLTWLSDGITKEEVFDVLVPKSGVVRDFIAPLKAKANLTEEDESRLRFYEVHGNKIFRDHLDEDFSVAAFNEFVTIYAELIPEEELEANPDVDRAVFCYHFEKEPTKAHSVPFKFIIKPGELFKETKERLSKRTGIKGKLFEKIKFAVVRRQNMLKPEYVEDDDVLSDKITTSDDTLGLDHINKSRNILARNDVMMIR